MSQLHIHSNNSKHSVHRHISLTETDHCNYFLKIFSLRKTTNHVSQSLKVIFWKKYTLPLWTPSSQSTRGSLFWNLHSILFSILPVIKKVHCEHVKYLKHLKYFLDYLCEYGKKNIRCPGGKIKIQEAIFGRTEAKRCARGNDFFCKIDVTEKIKKFCEDKESCAVVSSKEFLNIRFHPCFRYSKYLQIKRTCKIDGKIYIQLNGRT